VKGKRDEKKGDEGGWKMVRRIGKGEGRLI
jgi:hypothetical protein